MLQEWCTEGGGKDFRSPVYSCHVKLGGGYIGYKAEQYHLAETGSSKISRYYLRLINIPISGTLAAILGIG